MKNAIAFILACASAYALSFAIDLLLGGLFHVYPATAYLPVVMWSIIATITGIGSLQLAPRVRILVAPSLVLAALALFGAIVGHHYSLLVAAGMLVQAASIWAATTPPRQPTSLPGTA